MGCASSTGGHASSTSPNQGPSHPASTTAPASRPAPTAPMTSDKANPGEDCLQLPPSILRKTSLIAATTGLEVNPAATKESSPKETAVDAKTSPLKKSLSPPMQNNNLQPPAPMPVAAGVTVERLVKGLDQDGNKTINEYVILAELGRGSYGKVKLCAHLPTGIPVAIKVLDKSLLSRVATRPDGSLTAFDAVQKEIQIMKSLRHPNVVRLWQVIDDPSYDKLYIVMDLCDGGPISSAFDVIVPATLKTYLHDILVGIHYLHEHGVVHRDIKPENILLSSDCHDAMIAKGMEPRFACKLSDFGVSHTFDRDQGDVIHGKAEARVGTVSYFAPEIILGSASVSGKMCDVWAFGVTAFRLAFKGTYPFEGATLQLLCRSITTDPMRVPDDSLDVELYDLLAGCLEKDPEHRLTVEELLKHPYFEGQANCPAPLGSNSDALEATTSSSSSPILAGSAIRLLLASVDNVPDTDKLAASLKSTLSSSIPYLRKVLTKPYHEGEAFSFVSGIMQQTFPNLVDEVTPPADSDLNGQKNVVRCLHCYTVPTDGYFSCTVCPDVYYCSKCRFRDKGHDASHTFTFTEIYDSGPQSSQPSPGEEPFARTVTFGGGTLTELPPGEIDAFQPISIVDDANRSLLQATYSFSSHDRSRASSTVLTDRDEIFIELFSHTSTQVFKPRKSWAPQINELSQFMTTSPQENSVNSQSTPPPRKFSVALPPKRMGGGSRLPTEAEVEQEFAKNVEAMIDAAVEASAQEVALEYCQLTEAPSRISHLVNVCILRLANNDLVDLPDDIFDPLSSLERLYLGNNSLTSLPACICRLPHLVLLDANNNKLTSLPDGFENLVNLEILAIDFNRFTSIPSALSNCKELTKLYIINNLKLRDLRCADVLTVFKGSSVGLQLGIDNHPALVAQMKTPEMSHIEVVWNKLYADCIIPDKLYLGSLRTAQNEEVLAELGIQYVLTVGRDLQTPDWISNITQLKINVDDNDGVAIDQYFQRAFGFIEAATDGAVLVHCFAGMSRSATVVIAYLMTTLKMRMDEAYRHTKERRPAIHPNAGFMRQLMRLDTSLYGPDALPPDLMSIQRLDVLATSMTSSSGRE